MLTNSLLRSTSLLYVYRGVGRGKGTSLDDESKVARHVVTYICMYVRHIRRTCNLISGKVVLISRKIYVCICVCFTYTDIFLFVFVCVGTCARVCYIHTYIHTLCTPTYIIFLYLFLFVVHFISFSYPATSVELQFARIN